MPLFQFHPNRNFTSTRTLWYFDLALTLIFRPTWVQAEKRGFISRWRDWEGTRLRDILWYEDLEDQGQDEPTAGDKFGYIESESVWGAARTAVQPYYCVYNIDYLCSV